LNSEQRTEINCRHFPALAVEVFVILNPVPMWLRMTTLKLQVSISAAEAESWHQGVGYFPSTQRYDS
jgi:hypothetical protein